MGRADRTRRRWVIIGAAVFMGAATLADLLFAGQGFVVFLVLPLLVVAVVAGPRTTAIMGVAATVLVLIGEIPDNDFAMLEGWLHLVTTVLAAILLTAYSAWLNSWRAEVRQQDEKFRLLAENTMDLVVALDVKATIEWVSPSVETLLGYRPDELAGRFGGILIHPDDLPILLDASTKAREEHAHAVCRIRMVTKAGSPLWVEATPRGLYDDDGSLIGGVIGVRDVDAEVLAQQALAREVDFDALTALAKRPLALVRVAEVLQSRRVDGWALLCVGVNGMTAINQAYSFTAGDAVLSAVAARLIRAAGTADRVARIGGDEFIVILRDIVTPTDAANAAERLLDAVRGPVTTSEASVDVTCCVGVAMSAGLNAEELVRNATAAMRQASAKGTDRWEFLDGNIGAAARQNLTVQAALRDALASGSIVPWLMPMARLDTSEVVGWEALARWVHADGTVTEPFDFLPVAERSGLVIGVDSAMLTQALGALSSMPEHHHVAVNVSALTLATDSLTSLVDDALAATGISPTRLHLEVTETALLHVTAQVRETMLELADRGISWWVDDFGTGFSSITHLRDLPIVGLKLDQSFTAQVSTGDSNATRLAEGLAGLAKGLELMTVAEGVSTLEQAEVLRNQGWQVAQGWLVGQPRPIAEAWPLEVPSMIVGG